MNITPKLWVIILPAMEAASVEAESNCSSSWDIEFEPPEPKNKKPYYIWTYKVDIQVDYKGYNKSIHS